MVSIFLRHVAAYLIDHHQAVRKRENHFRKNKSERPEIIFCFKHKILFVLRDDNQSSRPKHVVEIQEFTTVLSLVFLWT